MNNKYPTSITYLFDAQKTVINYDVMKRYIFDHISNGRKCSMYRIGTRLVC